MKQPLLFISALLLLLGLLATSSAQASHIQAAEISYLPLGGSQYKVYFRVYRDCGGALFNSINPRLVYRTTACSTTPGSDLAMTLVSGSYHIGNDYCSTVGAPCGSGLPTNYETGLFETTITLPAGQWTLSVTLNARPTLGNVNAGSGDIYTEATLDNRNGIVNASPVFSSTSQVVSFVGWNLPTTFSEQATDPDGDSLTYELVAPLLGCSEPITYKSFASATLVDPADPTCYTAVPATTYSPTFPLMSFNVTGACPLRQIQPYFDFNRANGAITMRPALYNSAVNSPDNKNVVAVKVSEYRRSINSQGRQVVTLVGSIRRDMLFTVVDCGNNQNPVIAPITVNNSPATQPVTDVIPVVAGQLVSVRLRGTDVNSGQVLTMSSNVEQVLPNSEFTSAPPSVSPTVQIDWIPPLSLSPGLYYCTVTTSDSNCPIKGIQTQTLTFRVSSPALATQSAKAAIAVAAVPTPFQAQVSFTLAQPGIRPVLVFDQLGRQVATLQSLPSGRCSGALRPTFRLAYTWPAPPMAGR
ncbi:hypothetical protein [Hymenobacter cellulosivorans]|uniref:Gliding motility-associated C-terminal domain-containing protein n=1 Tax=Hymenobacter cellulosivorans TaxID=2932249 RepID=A0ABY4F745_9BACT|nr:hypothetical protein [Hymenobacter cellulosivorans]UOQ52205.1 hypothetical protein MUN80_20890 [Hymenobacter cellulosivorans]